MPIDDDMAGAQPRLGHRTGTPPVYPGETGPASHPSPAPPEYPVMAPERRMLPPHRAASSPPEPRRSPAVPPTPRSAPDWMRPPHDDLVLATGRKHLKAWQRGLDRAAFLRIAVSLPIALVSLTMVAGLFAIVSVNLAAVMALVWILSGALIFHRRSEAVIARRVLGMRRPDPAEARRLAEVWGEVTRRAGVHEATYELWVQERGQLNATSAAGHLVGVTRHALDRLPNSQLAAVLAHELGHHVGGHSWAGTLADWYALPARKVGRMIVLGLARLVRSGSIRALGWAGVFTVLLGVVVYTLAVPMRMWWLVLMVAAAPFLLGWLHRHSEFRADAFAEGLGFGAELSAVLSRETEMQGRHSVPAARLRRLHSKGLPHTAWHEQ